MDTDTLKKTGDLGGTRAGWFGYKPNPTWVESHYDPNPALVLWEHCRDRVQIISRLPIEANGLWFSHRKNTGPCIKAFFQKLERQLKVKPRSVFANTDHPENCIWMQPSPWWLETLVRRSFLTIALRSAQSYRPKKDNFIECFETNKYGKESMVAINLFLQGYTNYRGKQLHMFEGWNRLFRQKDEERVKAVLFRRKSKNNTNQPMADW